MQWVELWALGACPHEFGCSEHGSWRCIELGLLRCGHARFGRVVGLQGKSRRRLEIQTLRGGDPVEMEAETEWHSHRRNSWSCRSQRSSQGSSMEARMGRGLQHPDSRLTASRTTSESKPVASSHPVCRTLLWQPQERSIIPFTQIHRLSLLSPIFAFSLSLSFFLNHFNSSTGIMSLYSQRFTRLSFTHKSCPTLCDPMDCSMSGLPVLHHLPEFAQIPVHRIGDAV